MATATYNVTTIANVNKIWRKVQTAVQQGAEFMSEEWENLEKLRKFDVDWSAREITVPLDINQELGVASIPEGGFEARPSSVNVEELSLTWILMNARFTVSKTAKWIDQRNRNAMIERQMRFQAKKKLQAIGRRFGEYFYGFSTGILCDTSTNATQTNGIYTLLDAYGLAGLGPAGNNFNVTNFFEVGDYVALIDSGSLVANAIGVITAITPGTPSITVTWNGSVDADAGDNVVFANSLENTTIAGTDYNAALVGLLDMATSTSVHGLSKSSIPAWDVGYSSAAGGRFSGIKLRLMKQGIKNNGGGKLNTVIWSNGVENDVVASQQAALRFSDPFAMELDGAAKSRGIKFMTSRKVPNGYVFGYDKKSVRKLSLIDKPSDTPPWEDGDKLEDKSGFVFSMDFPLATVILNRGNFSFLSGLTEQ